MAEVGDEKIKFRDLDETEIDSEDLIEYILEKQSDSFILNICKETLVATGKSVINLAIYIIVHSENIFSRIL